MRLLDIDHLTVHLPGAARPLLDSVSLTVRPGEVVALVGESGSGKSTTAKAALGALPPGATATGSVRFEGTDVLSLTGAALRAHRAGPVALVHQDPRAALNPVRRIADFLTERGADRAGAAQLLASVGLSEPERRLRQRPHELSGGMLQRVVIAGALAAEPRLLLADEATSALDVTTQAEILALLRTLREERSLGLLLITHDLHLAAAYCDRVYVMYAGRVVEHRTARALFAAPAHPYTRGLLACSPTLGEPASGEPASGKPALGEPASGKPALGEPASGGPSSGKALRPLVPIPGRPPSLADAFTGCPFAGRCDAAVDACTARPPDPRGLPDGGAAACVHIEPGPPAAALTTGPAKEEVQP